MPASKFSSSLAIMASVVPEGPSVESYDEARAERIAEARVQQEEEDEEEEEEEEREDSPQEPTCVRDSMCTRNRAVHCHIGFVTVVEMHAPLLRVPHYVARGRLYLTDVPPASVPPGGDDGGPPKKRAYTRRAAPTSAPTVANNPAQTDIISTAASNLITLVSAAHTAAANCTAADPMAAASLGSQLQAWGPGPRSTAAAPTAAASSTAAPTSDMLANDMPISRNEELACEQSLVRASNPNDVVASMRNWLAQQPAHRQLQWQQRAETAINNLLN